ncbi:MAG: hypothetical protein K2J58_03630, partial [Muribaculaceae bacterium]|nr:hypothetical protein [Muribaculaceae bacterium]
MKIKSYILILMLLSLLSCAEEGPYTMGKMECKVEVSMVLPTSAIVSVTIPPNAGNILENGDRPKIYLSDRPLNSSEDFWNIIHQEYDYNYPYRGEYLSEQSHTFNFLVRNLKPNKT